MVDMTSIVALAGSLKTAADITKTAVDIRDGAKLQSKVIELQSVILSAQSSALSAQQDLFSLIQEVQELKRKVSELEGWNIVASEYELTQIDANAFAYMKKEGIEDTDPKHWLCVNCFENKRRSVLQYKGRTARDNGLSYHECPSCKAQVILYYTRKPSIPYKGD